MVKLWDEKNLLGMLLRDERMIKALFGLGGGKLEELGQVYYRAEIELPAPTTKIIQ